MKYLRSKKISLSKVKRVSILLNSGFSTNELSNFYTNLNTDEIVTYFDEKYGSLSKKLRTADYFNLIVRLDEIDSFKKDLLYKKINYPIFLLFFTFVIALFFRNIVLVQIAGTFGEIDITKYVIILNLVIYTFYILAIAICLSLIILRNKIIKYMIFELFTSKNEFVSKYITYQFIAIYEVLNQAGYKSVQCFRIIKELKKQKILSTIAYQINDCLEEGIDIKNAIEMSNLNKELKEIYSISDKTDNFQKLINDYKQVLNYDLKFLVNLYSKCFLFVSYLLICIIAVLMYQVLTLPMQLINTL